MGGRDYLSRLLDSLIRQMNPEITEVLVIYDATLEGIDEIRVRYPEIIFLHMEDFRTHAKARTFSAAHDLIDKRTAYGIKNAKGEIIGLLEDTCVPKENWCEQVLEAHQLPYAVIGGAIEHTGKGTLNWATFFLDFSRYLPPIPENRVNSLSDLNITYKRSSLENVRTYWIDRYNEFLVHEAFAELHISLWLRPQILVYQDRGELRFKEVARERYAWGRYFAGIRSRRMPQGVRLLYVLFSPAIPVIILIRIILKIFETNRHVDKLIKALPYLSILTIIWSLGELIGYITGKEFALNK